MNSYERDKQRVAQAAAEFPSRFGLRAFPEDRFMILLKDSYVSEGEIMLYTGILQPDGTWKSFAKGTPEELRANITPAPGEATAVSAGAEAWREVLHGPDSSTNATAKSSPKPKDLIDEQACGDLRLVLLTRMSWIDERFPHGREDCAIERTAALTGLIHLTNELGFECEGFLYGEGVPEPDPGPMAARKQYPWIKPHALATLSSRHGDRQVEIISYPWVELGEDLVRVRLTPGDPGSSNAVSCSRLTPVGCEAKLSWTEVETSHE